MYIAVEISCVFIEFWIVYFFLSCSFDNPKISKSNIILILLLGIILIILSFIENISFIRLGFTFLGVSLLIYRIYHQKVYHATLYGALFCVIDVISEVFTSIFFALLNLDWNIIFQLSSARNLYILVGHVVLVISFITVLAIKPLVASPLTLQEILSTIPCISVTILLCLILSKQYLLHAINIPFVYIIVLIGLMYTNIAFLYYIKHYNKQYEKSKEYALSNQHFLMQQKYYEQLHEQQESVRSLWHDLNKYISAAKIDSSESLQQLQEQIDEITSMIDTNNRTLNVILNDYLYQARCNDTILHLDINVPNELPITAADLYVILGNSLDNALDACSFLDTEHRYINLKLRLKNHILFYEVTNPYIEGNTSLKSKKVHGYGIKNIQRIAEKFDGLVLIQKEHGIFTLSAHFNLL